MSARRKSSLRALLTSYAWERWKLIVLGYATEDIRGDFVNRHKAVIGEGFALHDLEYIVHYCKIS